jgi:hypothetical protein
MRDALSPSYTPLNRRMRKPLAAALDRQRGLRVSYDRIERNPDLLRPIVAAKDVAEEEGVAGVR